MYALLRAIAGVLACVFGILLIPQLTLLVQIAAYSLVEAKLYLQDTVPIVHEHFQHRIL